MVVSSSNPHNKEISIRRRISEIYNKRQEDFPSLREYNNYLEEVECMIFDLVEGIDVEVIEEKIKKYSRENAEQIMINRARKAEELAAAMAAAKGKPLQADSDGGLNPQGGISGGQYASTVQGGQPRPAGMGPQPVPLGGAHDHQIHAMDDEEMMRLRAEKGGQAGGWSIELSKRRALEEAFASIWV